MTGDVAAMRAILTKEQSKSPYGYTVRPPGSPPPQAEVGALSILLDVMYGATSYDKRLRLLNRRRMKKMRMGWS